MNKLVAHTLGLTLAAVAAANAVGAQDPQSAKPTSMAVAVAETGISAKSWTVRPSNLQTTKAQQNEALAKLTEDLNRKIWKSFDIALEQKLESQFD